MKCCKAVENMVVIGSSFKLYQMFMTFRVLHTPFYIYTTFCVDMYNMKDS